MKYDKKLLELLKSDIYRTYKQKELARLLNVPKLEYLDFKQEIKDLVAAGRISKFKRGRIGMKRKTRMITGRLEVKTQGYGFVVQEDRARDVFISHLNMGTALNGDTVRVALFAETGGRNLEGKVTEVVERARKTIVGTYEEGRNWGIVVPDELKIQRDIYIPRETAHNAKSGQKVVVKMLEWEDEHLNPEGEIVEILGYPNEPGVDIKSIAKSFDLDLRFPHKVEQHARAIKADIPSQEIERRLDLRDELCFTIDPAESKDFDDAVSMKVLENGNYQLGVHIADVSYYVTEGSVVDKEALRRGTSVYMLNNAIPMLPEKLSNELCSLKPNEDRLCFSVLMELTPEAKKVRYDIKESIINSKRRFSYEEVQQIIEKPKSDKKFGQTLRTMFRLSKHLIEKRERRGGLDFDSHEVNIRLDENWKPVKIEKAERLDSHRIIEEFMILANTTIASHVSRNLNRETGNELPFPYRVHEKPGGDKLRDYIKFTRALGLDFPSHKKITPKLFQNFIAGIKGDDRELLVSEITVRTMMKAKYDVENIGHFGLALKNYCHFTSPIRRYPDLVCHRLMKSYLDDAASANIKRKRIAQICEKSTEREIVAQEAERASIRAKKLEFMEQFIGDEFDGIISGVVSFGIFVELIDNLIEGLVHITNLPDDYYIHDENRYRLYGQHSGRVYQVGDRVRVQVVQVNREAKIIDFDLVEET
ncbi:ribonuclease R [candidate division KSB1 bacterium]|nr:ribonuclease R [candidate division KSB1 bacterium]